VLDLSLNHFELLGLPVAYQVDAEQLAERYHELQRRLHPDRFAGASERERRLSVQASTRINEAYQTLGDPLRRAQYLLGLLTGEDSAGAGTSSDAAFLMEQMELREALAAARHRADPLAEVDSVLDRLAGQSVGLIAALDERFAGADRQDLEQAAELVRKLQFVTKCRAEAERLAAELDDPAAF
jgi:molecular chaperone HscB